MSSPIAFDDTQFDLDLSDHLDQYPDGPGAVPAAPARFEAVVPVGDAWGAPADVSTTGASEPEPEPAPVVQPRPARADEPAPVTDVDAGIPDEWVPADGPEPVVPAAAPAAPVAFAATTVEDVPVPWVPAEGGTATFAAAVARAVDPPTSVHSVFAVTPPQGTPAVVMPPVPPAPAAAVGGAPKASRRRRRWVAVLAAVLAAGLVAGGAGLAIATSDGGDDGDVAVADAPGQSVDLPPAGAEADTPDDAPDDAASPGDAALPPAADADGVAQATEAVQTFLAVRGTDAERAVSSQGGRDELDAAVATLGRAVAEGDPACSADADAGTFTCVLDTDQGPLTFTVGPDADDPQTSGFEVIGASAG